MTWVYADPPYPGKAHLYRDHADYAGEVDHGGLVQRLVDARATGLVDGWALSTSARSLPAVLELLNGLEADLIVAAWVKGAHPHGKPHGPAQAWEPVIVSGCRHGLWRPDALTHGAKARTTDPRRVIGAKPARFCGWLFELFGALPGDTLVDMFAGSGGVGRAWLEWSGAPAVASLDDLESSRKTVTHVPQ